LLPLNVSHVYVSDKTRTGGTYNSMKLGLGFRLNVMEQILPVASGGNDQNLYEGADGKYYRYRLIDGDGTVHFFGAT
jgi:hypothetical protein